MNLLLYNIHLLLYHTNFQIQFPSNLNLQTHHQSHLLNVESFIAFHLPPIWRHREPFRDCTETWAILHRLNSTSSWWREKRMNAYWRPTELSSVSIAVRKHLPHRCQRAQSTKARSSMTVFRLILCGWRCDPLVMEATEWELIPFWWSQMQPLDYVPLDFYMMRLLTLFKRGWNGLGFARLDPCEYFRSMSTGHGLVDTSKTGLDNNPFDWWSLLDKHMNGLQSSSAGTRWSDVHLISFCLNPRTTLLRASSMPWTMWSHKWIGCPMCRVIRPSNGLWGITHMCRVCWWKKSWTQFNYIPLRPLRWSFSINKLQPRPSLRPTMMIACDELFFEDTLGWNITCRPATCASIGEMLSTINSLDPKSPGEDQLPLSWWNTNPMKYFGWYTAPLCYEHHQNMSSQYFPLTLQLPTSPLTSHFSELNLHYNKSGTEESLSMWTF